MKRITGHLSQKAGKWYVVINLYDADGKRHEKWRGLNLETKKGTKREATYRLNQILDQYNSENMYLFDKMSRAERERFRVAEMPVEEYLTEWLENHKPNISDFTYEGYRIMLHSRMIPFFEPMHLKVREVTGDEINAYYIHIRNNGLKGTTAQKHHTMLHLAFKSAVKRRIIPSNPVEQADRPKGEQYIASYYTADEIKQLLDVTKDDPMHMVILFAAYYGLRRSEAVGLKWTAIDFGANTISIRHKVLQDKKGVRSYDVMKTKSSYRTLPLIPFVREELLKEKARQEEMKALLSKGYNHEYDEYICVDAVGNLITPNYVSRHFQTLLKNLGMRKIRFHDLRHSCASLQLANGVPMKIIQEWLGHSDMATTANIYSHVDSESKKAGANAIALALSQETNQNGTEINKP